MHPPFQRRFLAAHAHMRPCPRDFRHFHNRTAVIAKQHVAVLVRLGIERHRVTLLFRRADRCSALRHPIIHFLNFARRGDFRKERGKGRCPFVEKHRVHHEHAIRRFAPPRFIGYAAAIPLNFLIQQLFVVIFRAEAPFRPLLANLFAKDTDGFFRCNFAVQRQNRIRNRIPLVRPVVDDVIGNKAVSAPNGGPLAVIAHDFDSARPLHCLHNVRLFVACLINDDVAFKARH